MSPKRNASLTFIFITLLIDVIGIGIIIPVMPKLIEELTGEGISEASVYGGLLAFAYASTQFIFAPVLGSLSDKFGRRPVLLFSLFGLGIDYIFQAFAPTIGWLFIGRMLAGISGASFTTASAYIADISIPEKRAQNFGLIGAAFGIGFIIGPVVGGICGQWGARVPFMVAAGFTLLNFIYGYFFVPESLSKENRRAFDWKRSNPLGSLKLLKTNPIIAGLSITLLLEFLAAHSVQSNWAYYTMLKFSWSEQMIGYSLGFVGILIAIVQGGLIRVIIPKIGQNNAVYVGLILNAAALFLFGLANQGWMMFAILIPYSMAGIGDASLEAVVSLQVSESEQGELQGALTSLMSITAVAGPLIMNNMFAYFTSASAPVYFPEAPFILSSILVATGLLVAHRTLKRHNS